MEQNYLKALIDQNPGCFEKQLILGAIQSQSVFKQMSQVVCVRNPKDGTHSHDFTTRRYNFLFPVIASVWQIFGNAEVSFGLPQITLQAAIEADATTGMLSMQLEVARELLAELSDFFPATPPAKEFLGGLMGDGFAYWQDCRLARTFSDVNFNASRATIQTLDDIQSQLDRFRSVKVNTTNRIVSPQDYIKSKIKIQPFITARSLPRLMKTIGGGFVRKEATMVCAMTGGGKTVLACQFARDFMLQGIPTAYVTTEQPPDQLTIRKIVGHLQCNIEVFTNRPEAVNQNPDACIEVDAMPRIIMEDPRFVEGLTQISDAFANLRHVDWSKGEGLTVNANLGAEFQKMESTGFNPQVLIFDWIGSALDASAGKDVKIHELYCRAAKWLIDYGKAKNCVVIVMAQLDKVRSINKPKPDVSMIGNSKNMIDNFTNCIMISSMMEGDASSGLHKPRQNLFVAKGRNGPGGVVPFQRDFHRQNCTEIGVS